MSKKYFNIVADTANGCYFGEAPEGVEVLDSKWFYRSLADLKVGEIIYGLVDEETTQKIKKEYGIQKG